MSFSTHLHTHSIEYCTPIGQYSPLLYTSTTSAQRVTNLPPSGFRVRTVPKLVLICSLTSSSESYSPCAKTTQSGQESQNPYVHISLLFLEIAGDVLASKASRSV